jgi:predicted esterase
VSDPHAGGPVEHRGAPLESSRAAVIMLHGRNAGPANILELAPALLLPGVTFLAPAAAGRTWYPFSFLVETERNEPYLSSALRRVDALVEELVTRGIPRTRIVLLGFSQGGCLASEYVVRHAQRGRFGGLVGLSAGLIGPPGTRWDYPGELARMPVVLGCSDGDSHVPESRVHESAAVLTRMGADVSVTIYPGMGHRVNDDEIERTRRVVEVVTGDR